MMINFDSLSFTILSLNLLIMGRLAYAYYNFGVDDLDFAGFIKKSFTLIVN